MTTHKHARSPLLATLTLATVAFLAGSAITGAVATHIALKQVRELTTATERSAARTKLLEGLLAQQTVEPISLSSSPVEQSAPVTVAHVESAKPDATPTPNPAETTRSREPIAAKDTEGHNKDSSPTKPTAPNKASAPKPAPEPSSPAPVPKVQISATPASSPAQTVQVKTNALMTTDAVVATRDKNKIEAIPASALGIVRLTSDGVELKNGRIVQIGGAFPSGDRLLATDLENGQIVTDRRTILVL